MKDGGPRVLTVGLALLRAPCPRVRGRRLEEPLRVGHSKPAGSVLGLDTEQPSRERQWAFPWEEQAVS